MKSRVVALLVLLFATLLPIPALAQAPTAGQVRSTANLRGGPGVTYPIVGHTSAGTSIKIAGCNDDCTWYMLDNGNWIAAFLVDAVAVAASPATPTSIVAVTPTAAPAAAATPTQTPVAVAVTGTLTVSFLDVGQGDSILLQGQDFTILIDTGRQGADDVVPQLQQHGVKSIDLLVGTHPHADHIGQFPEVLKTFPVKDVWMSGDTNTTKAFEDALDAISASKAGYHEPRTGEVYQIGSARLEVLQPDSATGDINNESIVIRVVFGDVDMLFTGDAEAGSEGRMLAEGHDLHAQILKLGHHGSHTSSTPAFLQAVDPEVAVWSAGLHNEYGHPNADVLDRLAQMGVKVLGTAIDSPIMICTDGISYKIGGCPATRAPIADGSGSTVAAATTAAPAAVSSKPAASSTIAAVTDDCSTAQSVANIRSGPGTSFAIVGHTQAGQCLTITGTNDAGDWLQLSDGTWIASFLVDNPRSFGPVTGDPPLSDTPTAVAATPEPRASTPVPPTPLPPTATPEPTAAGPTCDPNYAGACIPIVSGDLNCTDISDKNFQVVGNDHYRLDRDHDGIACEQH